MRGLVRLADVGDPDVAAAVLCLDWLGETVVHTDTATTRALEVCAAGRAVKLDVAAALNDDHRVLGAAAFDSDIAATLDSHRQAVHLGVLDGHVAATPDSNNQEVGRTLGLDTTRPMNGRIEPATHIADRHVATAIDGGSDRRTDWYVHAHLDRLATDRHVADDVATRPDERTYHHAATRADVVACAFLADALGDAQLVIDDCDLEGIDYLLRAGQLDCHAVTHVGFDGTRG